MGKNWYKVRSPEGYVAMELAWSEKEACRIAANTRPGYAPAEACRAEIYITESERSACRAGLEAARERMGNR